MQFKDQMTNFERQSKCKPVTSLVFQDEKVTVYDEAMQTHKVRASLKYVKIDLTNPCDPEPAETYVSVAEELILSGLAHRKRPSALGEKPHTATSVEGCDGPTLSVEKELEGDEGLGDSKLSPPSPQSPKPTTLTTSGTKEVISEVRWFAIAPVQI